MTENIIEKCMGKHKERRSRYGISWKYMTPAELNERFLDEFDEYYFGTYRENSECIMGEIRDIIICLWMLHERIKDGERE